MAELETQVGNQEAEVQALKTDVQAVTDAQAAQDGKIAAIETMVTALTMEIDAQVSQQITRIRLKFQIVYSR